MKAQSNACCGGIWLRVLMGGVLACLGLAAVLAAVMAAPGGDRSPGAPSVTEVAAKPVSAMPDGKELFAREWIPHDPRSPRGDGLGPVFNDTSCVACHNQGGAGGGGPASKNVHILTTTNLAQVQQLTDAIPAVLGPAAPQAATPGQTAATNLSGRVQQPAVTFAELCAPPLRHRCGVRDVAGQNGAVRGGRWRGANPLRANAGSHILCAWCRAGRAQRAASNGADYWAAGRRVFRRGGAGQKIAGEGAGCRVRRAATGCAYRAACRRAGGGAHYVRAGCTAGIGGRQRRRDSGIPRRQ